jgi:trans-aconitate methyltransferase
LSDLQPVADVADLYDWECAHVARRTDQDVGFYLDLARHTGGPVLELACGSGRVTGPLAATGVEVVGVDVNPTMLAAARRRWPDVALVCADMRRFALRRRFRLVVVAYNGLQLVDGVGQSAVLARIGEHLTPDGILAYEVTDFSAARYGCDLELVAAGRLGDERVELWGGLDHDPATGATTYHRRFVLTDGVVNDPVLLWPLDAEAIVAAGVRTAAYRARDRFTS